MCCTFYPLGLALTHTPPPYPSLAQVGCLLYIFAALALVVFLAEFRVRKNEALRALRRLVGSVDKYYIRYM